MTPEFRAWYTPFKDSNFGQTMKYGRAGTILNFAEMSPDKYVVEQYTGLKDVNGNKIFEGDIVKTDQHGYNQPDSYVLKEFIQNVCVFRSAQVTDGSTMFEEATNGHDLTVIGNIHENPELLEVDE